MSRTKSQTRKPVCNVSTKESLQQNQTISELLRSVISRSEDINLLRTISEKKTNRLKLQSVMAEKTILEAEYKEEWRACREDTILTHLANLRFDSPVQKKYWLYRLLEKIAKKMLRVSLSVEDDLTDRELNLSEVHVNMIMNVKIGPDTTYWTTNDQGRAMLNLPPSAISHSAIREQMSKVVRVIESCLYGDVVNVHLVLIHCVNYSRECFHNELARQKLALEQGLGPTPNISVFVTNKRNKTALPTPKKGGTLKKYNLAYDEDEWMDNLYKNMLEQNSDISRNLKKWSDAFRSKYPSCEIHHQKLSRAHTGSVLMKLLRARNFEKNAPVNPNSLDPISVRPSNFNLLWVPNLNKMIFDLDSEFFDEDKDIPERIRIIHACHVIQSSMRRYRKKKLEDSVIKIQRQMRMKFFRNAIFQRKLAPFKRMYLLGRLKHWLRFVVRKRRESRCPASRPIHYFYSEYYKICKIQGMIRSYLEKKRLFWRVVFNNLKNRNKHHVKYKEKQILWSSSLNIESAALKNSQSVQEMLEILRTESNPSEPETAFEIVSFESAEMQYRDHMMINLKEDRHNLLFRLLN